MRIRLLLFVCWLAVFTVEGHLSAGNDDRTSRSSSSLASEKAALDKAAAYTGFGKFGPFATDSAFSDTVSTENCPIPFLQNEYKGKAAWTATFRDVVVPWDCIDSTRWTEFARNFEVTLDEKTGKLLGITSVAPERTRGYENTSTRETEERLRMSGIDIVGLPDSVAVPFIKALAACPHSPHLAYKITARYALETSRAFETPRPLWNIRLLGIPPVKYFGPGAQEIPKSERSSSEIVIDGLTGEVLVSISPGR